MSGTGLVNQRAGRLAVYAIIGFTVLVSIVSFARGADPILSTTASSAALGGSAIMGTLLRRDWRLWAAAFACFAVSGSLAPLAIENTLDLISLESLVLAILVGVAVQAYRVRIRSMDSASPGGKHT